MSSSSNKRETARHTSGMTPSILSTINNTNPTPPVTNSTNNNGNSMSKTKRTSEPFYESYIEDSFVGHWEREDDDLDDEFAVGNQGDTADGGEDDESALHPSTIEFDFDSFGPESFIYTPAAVKPLEVVKEDDVQEAKLTIGNDEVKLGEVNSKTNETQETNQATICQNQPIQSPNNYNNFIRPCTLNTIPLDHLVDNVQIDLKVIEPYKKVISHAGYCHHFDTSSPPPKPGEQAPAVIVFSACYLPDRSRRDYNYVMDHLFLYVLTSLHELIADDYILIYLHNTQPSNLTSSNSSQASSASNLRDSSSSTTTHHESQCQNNLPTFTWMKRCYQMIDRKLRKNLKILYLVKPTFWLKTIVIMCKPFISTKFSKKLRFVENMDDLKKCLPVDKLILPASAENL